VDRIAGLEVTGHTFVPRPLADAARMVAEGLTNARYGYQAVVSLNAPLEDAARLISPYTAVLEREGDRTRVQLGFDDFDWVAGYLIGLGLEFEVVEPDELRRHMTALAERLSRVHGAANAGQDQDGPGAERLLERARATGPS
jgi:predicted DNA-binding transcriptional regulator YafY